jgi:hypothetical protein
VYLQGAQVVNHFRILEEQHLPLCLWLRAREAFVLDAIHQQPVQLMREDRRHGFHEGLGIVEEFVQPTGRLQDSDERRPGELGFVLQVGQEVRDGTVPVHHGIFCHAHGVGRDSAAANTKLPGNDADARRLDPFHAFDGLDRALHQDIRLELDPVGGPGLDALPECLELGAKRDLLLQVIHPLVPLLADVSLDLVGRQQIHDRRHQVALGFGQIECEVRALRVERRLDTAIRVEHLLKDGTQVDVGLAGARLHLH